MASTYSNTGIELIGVGEQSNTWGQTTNTNWRLVEELATGVVSISLNGLSSYSLTTTDGLTSNGRHLVIEFTGSPDAACTVTVSPSDMQKLYFINNATDQTITVTQGSGADVDIPAGFKKIVYCDGGGGSAAVTDLTQNLGISGSIDVTSLSIDGTEVTATVAELNTLDGITASTAELNVLDGIVATTDEVNKLDGFTGVAADLNYAKDLRATGVTTTEFDVLDGLTASTAELNTLDGVTANATELNYLDGAAPGTLANNKAVIASDTGVIALGSTWSVREDDGVLYFESTGGGSVEVNASGDLTTSGKIFASGEIVVE